MAVKQKRWNLFMPEELLEQLRELAERKHVTSADIVRTACEKYLAAVKRAEEARANVSA
jgi:predicted DNA-binding protein